MSEENNWNYGTNEQNVNQGNPVNLEKHSTEYNYGQPDGSAEYNYGQPDGSADYNYGQPNGSNKSESEGFGIASLILGIITVLMFCTCISWITGILAIIFGILQLVKGNKRGLAIVGLITGGIGFTASVILYILIFFTGIGSYSNYNEIYDHIYDDIYDDMDRSLDDGTI